MLAAALFSPRVFELFLVGDSMEHGVENEAADDPPFASSFPFFFRAAYEEVQLLYELTASQSGKWLTARLLMMRWRSSQLTRLAGRLRTVLEPNCDA